MGSHTVPDIGKTVKQPKRNNLKIGGGKKDKEEKEEDDEKDDEVD